MIEGREETRQRKARSSVILQLQSSRLQSRVLRESLLRI